MMRLDAARRHLLNVLIAAAALTASATIAADDRESGHVPDTLRCHDPYLNRVIDHGLASSASLRELVAHLRREPVIIYVRFNDGMLRDTFGRTRLTAVAHGWRYISIELTPRLIQRDLMTMFGHELQHAVEIADAPEVVDVPSLVAFYRRVGQVMSSGGRTFETNAAVATERRVLLELVENGW